MKFAHWAFALVACALLIVSPAFADTSSTIDVGGGVATWMPTISMVVGTVVSTLVGWVLILAAKKLGISVDDSMRDSLQTAAKNGAGLLLNTLGNQLAGKSIDVKSPFVAQAVNYVIANAPAAIAHFGLTPEKIAEKIVALLPQIANTPAAPVSVAAAPAASAGT